MYNKNLIKAKVLFLYYDPHYFHAALAKKLNADFYPAPKLRSEKSNIIIGGVGILKSVFTIPKNYDIYFCEGTYIIPAIAKKLGLIKKDAKIINILASPLIYYINTGLIKGIRRKFAIYLLKEVNLFVYVGKMEKDLLENILPDANGIVTYTYINPKTRKELIAKNKIIPNLKSHRLLVISKSDAYYKGIDIVFEAFKIVKRKYPDTKLYIVGKMPDLDKYIDCKYNDVNCFGYVKDLTKVIKDSSLYVHMGRGDTFPASSLEAMLGGLPVIVSDMTGTKEVVEKVNKNMICELDAKELSNKIINYFNLTQKEKILLSKKFYMAALKFKKGKILDKFVIDFKGALK